MLFTFMLYGKPTSYRKTSDIALQHNTFSSINLPGNLKQILDLYRKP